MKNPRVAITIMIVAIAFSVLYGSRRSLASEAARVESVFFNGVEGDGIGIDRDLGIRIDESQNLVTIAMRYLDENDPSIKAVREARQALIDAVDLYEKHRANLKLTEAYTALGDRLARMELSEKDERYRMGILDELKSREEIIGHDGYNEMAEEFNTLLERFPANILGRLTGIKPLVLFR